MGMGRRESDIREIRAMGCRQMCWVSLDLLVAERDTIAVQKQIECRIALETRRVSPSYISAVRGVSIKFSWFTIAYICTIPNSINVFASHLPFRKHAVPQKLIMKYVSSTRI